MSGLRASAAAVAGALALAVPAASAAPAPGRPWATINVCDTTGHPDGLGVRGSLPGLGTRRTHMYLRIRVQFQTGQGTWQDLGASGDSGWLDVGKSRVQALQAGRTFTITPPEKGQSAYVLRARVAFEWRRGSRVLRRASALTTAGHRDVMGGDPPGFSAATCSIA